MKRNIPLKAALLTAVAAAAWGAAPLVRHAQVEGVVSPVMADFVVAVIDRAEADGAALVVISLDTPGGLDPSMRKIVQRILSARVPVAAYVAPPGGRAASAGTFITLAAHVAAMAPNTSLGAAHPVMLGEGSAKMDDDMSAKVTNDAVSYIVGLAKTRGRNEKWAELAVRKSASLEAEDAVAENVVDFVAVDLADLLAKAEGRTVNVAGRDVILRLKGARVEEENPGWRERLLAALADPNIAYILLLLGINGLLFELSNPGAILPGVVGGLCLILAFYSLATLPVNYAGVALIVFALILFIAEIKVTSHGLLTVGGVISMLMGSLLLIDSPAPFMRVSWTVILPAVLLTAAFFIFVVALGLKAQTRKPVTGDRGMVGEQGYALTAVGRQGGQVHVHGEYWEARSETEIPAGAPVEVVGTEKLRLLVKRVE